jgi:hypothetical protein
MKRCHRPTEHGSKITTSLPKAATKGTKVLRRKWRTPKELGIPLLGIKRIYFGDCGAKNDPPHYDVAIALGFQAHTHMCKHDKLYKSICLPKEDYLFNSDGSISDIMWHEYGHILDITNNRDKWPKIISCTPNGKVAGMHEYKDTPDSYTFLEYSGHSKSWETIMRQLGKKPTRVVNSPTKVS